MIQRVHAQNGLAGFWRGNSADVARAAPASAIRFYAFAAYKAKLTASTVLPAALKGAASISLFAGGFAGMTAMMAGSNPKPSPDPHPTPNPSPHPHPTPNPSPHPHPTPNQAMLACFPLESVRTRMAQVFGFGFGFGLGTGIGVG